MKFVIIPTEYVNQIDFSQVENADANDCHTSIDGRFTIIVYQGEMPSSMVNIGLDGSENDYAHLDEVLSMCYWQSQGE